MAVAEESLSNSIFWGNGYGMSFHQVADEKKNGVRTGLGQPGASDQQGVTLLYTC